MFEYHGWIVVCEDVLDEGRANDRLDLLNDVRARISTLDTKNPFLDLRVVNGSFHVLVTGLHNRRVAVFEELLEMYRYLGRRARRSYGLLYVRDDEDAQRGNEFVAWVLARGELTERVDAYLSPCVPAIED